MERLSEGDRVGARSTSLPLERLPSAEPKGTSAWRWVDAGDRIDAGSPLVGAHGVRPLGGTAPMGGALSERAYATCPYDGTVPAPMTAVFRSPTSIPGSARHSRPASGFANES
jgi:hypothetical protein